MNEELFWRAVKKNDKRFDGVFFTCVKTTKIFCKPSCPARLPKRENIYFVETILRAERDGFRACLRCKPKNAFAIDPQVQTALEACRLIDESETTTLKSLGEELGISPYHLQRTFKKIIGITPKKYSEARKIARFKVELKEGKEVAEAIYGAGYGSSSRLYENVSGKLGMTPARYKRGGEGVKIEYAITDSALGRLLVAQTERGVCGLKFGDADRPLLQDLESEYSKAEIRENKKGLKTFVDIILKFIEGKDTELDLPVDVRATAFQMKVWEALRKIPYGKTVTYKQLAEKLGNPKAVRAVANACARNRVALVIPCHRVVGSDGKMTGYRWGIERKKKLLENEALHE